MDEKMKRFLLTLIITLHCCSLTFAGKFDVLKGAGYTVYKHPDEAFGLLETLINFAIDLIVACIPILIIAGIISMILKSVFNLDKDDTIKTFLISGMILLGIWFLLYVFIW